MVDPLSTAFSALADPTRRAILARLAQGEATVKRVGLHPFEISLPAISRHLKVLEGAGLISRSREAQWRPAQARARTPQGSRRLVGGLSAFLGAELGQDGAAYLEEARRRSKQ